VKALEDGVFGEVGGDLVGLVLVDSGLPAVEDAAQDLLVVRAGLVHGGSPGGGVVGGQWSALMPPSTWRISPVP
jgi:hypothetical protein